MAKKKYSIKKIAEDLGISVTTISFVLNGKAEENRISPAMIEKVKRHVKKIGYQPNQLAKSLRTGKSNLIVFMVEDISNPFFANIAKLIEDEASKLNYKIIYCSTNNDPDKTMSMINLFGNLQADGFIITPPNGLDVNFVKELCEEQAPIILFDRYLPEVDCSHVVIANYEGTKLGLNHLIDSGFHKIGFITLDSDQSQMHDRLEAYQDLCANHSMTAKILKIPFYAFKSGEESNLINNFLDENPELDAIFFATNYLAIRGIKLLKDRGVIIPNDLAVMAFDDNDFFQFSTPSISSIVQPKSAIATQLIELMFQTLETDIDQRKPVKVELPVSLNIRSSTKNCN
ncbi:LacI family transcriptional regulator [Belliella sp. DSM 111904]|uniref:LacI family transcriptional regulator n=1 Tax=Belliella filtrata TaxID=2923435 RepID=A0ABS9V1Y0_9BACT|nr:LacI family DNA-binding transcriptional regulator [Belliella filtrata]MCH7410429.1 LacI family transcriptional regulator [Belliella filtrata]